jgi:putative endonuclease
MWYVYIVRSIDFPDQEYIGATANLKQRIPDHNAGKSTHTAKFKPWKLVWYCAFPDKYKALAFGKYLKSHSGRAFAKKRLLLGVQAPHQGYRHFAVDAALLRRMRESDRRREREPAFDEMS